MLQVLQSPRCTQLMSNNIFGPYNRGLQEEKMLNMVYLEPLILKSRENILTNDEKNVRKSELQARSNVFVYMHIINIKTHKLMSFFLIQINRWSKEMDLEQKIPTELNEPTLAHKQSLQRFDACMMRHLIRHKEFTTTFSNQDSHFKTYGVYFDTKIKNLHGLMIFLYRKKNKEVSVYFHFLDQNGDFLKISSMHMYNQVFRSTFLRPEAHKNSVKLLLNVDNGCISFQICYYSTFGSNLLCDMNQAFIFRTKNIVLELYNIFVLPLLPIIEKALKVNVPLQIKDDLDTQQTTLLENIHRYSKMMTTKVNLNSLVMESQENKVYQLQQRTQTTKKLFQRKVQLSDNFKKSFQLFGVLRVPRPPKKNSHDFQISTNEEKQLFSILAQESEGQNPKQGASHQNILNYINIMNQNPNELKTFPLNFGGFSYIESAEVKFKFIDSFSSNKTDVPSNRPALEKRMAIKRENRPHGKNLHEYRILVEMRNSINSLFPKYFIPMNMQKHKHDQNPLLMMEFLPDGNLSEFTKNRKKCISLLTKLYLLYSVSMALRHLESYKIVHLDIKPNNVMLAPGLQVKIIDFGEAFHPNVWKQQKNYRHGWTFPYCPPQFPILLKNGTFSSKSDAYSFGVMMFEVLFGRVPFQGREKMFLAPENCDLYGDPVVVRLLNWMISRCLSRNPEIRPELDWISIILRLCLEVVT